MKKAKQFFTFHLVNTEDQEQLNNDFDNSLKYSTTKDELIELLQKYNNSLTKINLTRVAHVVDDEVWETVKKNFRNLEITYNPQENYDYQFNNKFLVNRLNRWNERLKNEGVEPYNLSEIFGRFPNNRVSELDLSSVAPYVTDELVELIVSKFPNLEKINLSGCVDITENSLQNIRSQPKIVNFNLTGCSKIDSEFRKDCKIGENPTIFSVSQILPEMELSLSSRFSSRVRNLVRSRSNSSQTPRVSPEISEKKSSPDISDLVLNPRGSNSSNSSADSNTETKNPAPNLESKAVPDLTIHILQNIPSSSPKNNSQPATHVSQKEGENAVNYIFH